MPKLRTLLRSLRYRRKENYITAHADVAWWEQHINNLVLAQYGSSLTGRVADFGCNHGACTILAARNPAVRSVVGFDLNGEAVAAAEQLLARAAEPPAVKGKVRFVQTHLSAIGWPDDAFDSAYMFHVLEHIYPRDREDVFAEIRRVLVPGAPLIITLPFEHAYDDGTQHVAFFNEASLRRTLEGLGLDVRECYRDRRRDAHTPGGHDCLNAACTVIKDGGMKR